MRQRGQIGEAQRREIRVVEPRLMPPARERAEIAVGKRQDHEIRGFLPQILRDGGFLHPVRFAKDDVHGFWLSRPAPP